MSRRRQQTMDGLRALNRFGLGAQVGEADQIPDPRGWLEDQIAEGDSRATSGEPPITPAEIGRAFEARNELVTRVLSQTRSAQQPKLLGATMLYCAPSALRWKIP